ncbi:MAG: hypothetical protein ABR499_00800 [Gemmatimonadaceae bacterium]
MESVDRFYRVRFADDTALRAWAVRVLEFTMALQSAAPSALDPRPVVFVPLMPHGPGPVFAYVSEATLRLPLGLGRDAQIDGTVLSLRELPEGLMLLYGDEADAAAYERRLSQ